MASWPKYTRLWAARTSPYLSEFNTNPRRARRPSRSSPRAAPARSRAAGVRGAHPEHFCWLPARSVRDRGMLVRGHPNPSAMPIRAERVAPHRVRLTPRRPPPPFRSPPTRSRARGARVRTRVATGCVLSQAAQKHAEKKACPRGVRASRSSYTCMHIGRL